MLTIKQIAHYFYLNKIKFVVNTYHKFLKFKNKLPDDDNLIVDVDSQKMMIWNPSHGSFGRSLYLDGIFESEVTNYFCDSIKPSMVVLDVGADMGYYTLLFAKRVGKDGRVYSFEPIPWSRDRLIKNINLNDYENVIVSDYALYDENGTTKMIKPGNESRLSVSMNSDDEGEFEVKLITFDDFFSKNKVEKVDVVKIDTEGSELNVLKGMENTLLKFRPIVMVEIHYTKIKHFGFKENDVLEFMNKFGYKNKVLSTVGLEKHTLFYTN